MKTRILPLLLLLFAACATNKKLAVSADLYQHWMHSYEEDDANVKMYRPASYSFPPSRGREGFEIKKDGTFIKYAIGANDAPQKIQGKWKAKKRDTIEVTLDDPAEKPYTIKILSVNAGQLKTQQ